MGTIAHPTISLNFIDADGVTKATPRTVLRALAQQTISCLPLGAIRVYTDGAASVDTGSSGCGVYIEYPDPDKTTERLSGPCGNVCSFDAELVAIGEAFRRV